jgi:hypothetical protein
MRRKTERSHARMDPLSDATLAYSGAGVSGLSGAMRAVTRSRRVWRRGKTCTLDPNLFGDGTMHLSVNTLRDTRDRLARHANLRLKDRR